ncbi:hypothetical protein HYR65_03785, partial [Candidatus Azambacteria bacterium]|nr:hypothetical protein [Candidatus Azambacteria bacterium]
MFSIVLYTFCSVVSLWTGRYFYAVWKKSRNADHLEFALFFFVLGLGFVIYLLAPVFFVPLAGVVAEVGLLVVLFSFAFVLRAFAHFARLPFSPNMLSIAVVALIGLKLMVWSVPWFLWPALNNALVRWDYPVIDSLVFGALVFIFSFSIAFTLITHSVGV